MNEQQPNQNEPVAAMPKRRGKGRKWLVVLAVVLAVIGVWLVGRKGKTQQASTEVYQFVRTVTLNKGTLSESVTVNGTVNSGDEASVTVADIAKSYKVATVNVEVGDTVKEGDVIATLDTADLLKQIENAERSYNDTLQSAQTTYDRAVEDYDIAVVEHDNRLIDLQKNIDDADAAVTKAQNSYNDTESDYNRTKGEYDQLKAAYDAANAQITTFQAAYDSASTALSNALNALNSAIANYQNVYAAAQNEYNTNGGNTPSNAAGLQACAQDLINAYCLYNGNVGTTSMGVTGAVGGASAANTVDIAALQQQLAAVAVDGGLLHDGGVPYSSSAAGVCDSAAANLNDAKSSVSAPSLGYTGYTAIEQAYKQAETAWNAAQTALDNAKTMVENAEKQLTAAHQSYDTEKNSTLLKTRAQNIEDAKTRLEQAERTPDTLTTLQDTLEDCTLKATMSGTVTALDATVGSACIGTVATIQDTNALVVAVTISSDSVPELKVGMPCRITSDATGSTVLNGTLTQIDPVANATGTFGGKVKVTDGDGLLIGTSAKVEIVMNETNNVFSVPIDAVGHGDDGKPYVLRKTGGSGVDMTFEEVPVTTGNANDYSIEIEAAALNEGDVIRASADLTQGFETSDNTMDLMQEMMNSMGDMGVTVTTEGGPGGHGDRPNGGRP